MLVVCQVSSSVAFFVRCLRLALFVFRCFFVVCFVSFVFVRLCHHLTLLLTRPSRSDRRPMARKCPQASTICRDAIQWSNATKTTPQSELGQISVKLPLSMFEDWKFMRNHGSCCQACPRHRSIRLNPQLSEIQRMQLEWTFPNRTIIL